jgi:hypothetical protein
MSAPPEWQKLASALRELHRALMERARRDYERTHGAVLSPGELLRLLTTDAYFEWLRGLSELMVDIDVVSDAEPALIQEMATAVRAAVEHFISAPKIPASSHAFAQHYWPYVQDDPHVAMAHAGVKRALEGWPRAETDDAASLLHERHRLAEKARNARPRKK